MRILGTVLVVTLVLTGALNAARAQSNWLKQGEDMLQGLGTGGTEGGVSGTGLTTDEVANGLLEALRLGAERVVGQVGQQDGYNGDPAIHIPLPESLQNVQQALQSVGLSGMADDLELRLNRGAEAAAPEAKAVFFKAIEQMTWEDVQQVYEGPDDAATQYFQRTMTPELTERFTPIVEDALSEVGAIRSYDDMMAQYQSLPFVPDVKSDLSAYTVEQALDGLFYYLAKEEAAIRNNPAKRTTELLQKVFGSS